MTEPTAPPAPDDLSDASKALWKAAIWPGIPLCRQAAIESALRSLDQANEAAAILKRDGLTTANKDTGVIHAHPATRIEKDARAAFHRTWAAMGLDNLATKKPYKFQGN